MNFLEKLVNALFTVHGRTKRWHKVVSVMAAVVVFVTTYALILPALTLDESTASDEPGIILEETQEAAPEDEPAAAEEEAEESEEEEEAIDAEEIDPAEEESSEDSEEDPAEDETGDELPSEAENVYASGTLTARGGDYVITAEFGEDACLPEGVTLEAAEILPGDPEYQNYYDEALRAVQEEAGADLLLSYARFFDISFMTEEGEKEPEAGVSVKISYTKDPITVHPENELHAVHFADEPEVVDLETKGRGKEVREVSFEAEQFSVWGIVGTTELFANVISASGSAFRISVRYDETSGIPSDAELRVREIVPGEASYQNLLKKADDALTAKYESEAGVDCPVLFDISIWADGKEIEPKEGSFVSVEITLSEERLTKDSGGGETADASSDEESDTGLQVWFNGQSIPVEVEEGDPVVDVIHVTDDGETEVIDRVSVDAEGEDEIVLSFETGSFSDYIINGQTGDGKNYVLRALPSTMYVGDTVYLYYQNIWDEGNKTVNINGVGTVYTPVPGDNRFREVRLERTGRFQIGDRWIEVKEKPAGSHPAQVSTVSNSEIGVTMNMFDYDLDDSLDSHFNQFGNSILPYQRTYVNDGINNGHKFKFWGSGIGTWGDNQNNRAGVNLNYNQYNDGATTNIVENNLSGGYPKLNGGESLSYLFEPSDGTDKKAYTNVDGFFQKDDLGYYYYDSNQNYAWLNPDTKQFEIYTGTYNQWSNSDAASMGGYDNGKAIGFFPFHEWNSSYDLYVNWNKNLNHHFGLSMSVDFSLPGPQRAAVDKNGNDIVFEFSGDDDMWVFIDGKLAMDIGGIHQPVSGTINFQTGQVTVGGNRQNPNIDFSALNDGKPHKLEVFYLERGGCDSNCKIKFNLTQYADVEFDKVDEDSISTGLPNAKFGLFEDAQCSKPLTWYNKSKQKKNFEAVSDANGHVKFEGVPLGTWYLKEIDPPEGYIRDENPRVVQVYLDGKTVKFSVDGKDVDLSTDGLQLGNRRPKITADKKWLDSEGNEIEPANGSGFQVRLALYKGSSPATAADTSSDLVQVVEGNGKATWILKSADATPYTVKETGVKLPGDSDFTDVTHANPFEGTVTGTPAEGFLVTNQLPETELSVKKKWISSENEEEVAGYDKITSVYYRLFRKIGSGAEEEVTPASGDPYYGTLTGTAWSSDAITLPAYAADGSGSWAKVSYYVKECDAEGNLLDDASITNSGEVSYSEGTPQELFISNKLRTYSAEKLWQDCSEIDAYTVALQLKQGDAAYGEPVRVAKDDTSGKWEYTWTDLPVLDPESGETYTYTAEETGVYADAASTDNLKDEFIVTVDTTDPEKTVITNARIPVEILKTDMEGNPLPGPTFTLAKKKDGAYADTGLGTKTSGSDGKVSFGGLGIGEYQLEETGTKEGYTIQVKQIEFEVKADGTIELKNADAIKDYVTNADGSLQITIKNEPGAQLPNAGGPGTSLYTLSGLLLIMGAALMYIFRMRRRERRLN